MNYLTSPLVSGIRDRPRARLISFALWLLLIGSLASAHVLWRDEVRAYTLALSGADVIQMLRNIHGEGHPALWYLIVRGAHDLFPHRDVLQTMAIAIGIAAMGVFTWFAPFRSMVIGLVLFSFFGAFEYVVVCRNYGIAALVMFCMAALYDRVKGTLFFGAMLIVLCNTNVPSCMLAGAFLLFRFVELLASPSTQTRHDWVIFCGNAVLALLGAFLCFITVYPTVNDQAVSSNLSHLSSGKILAGLFDAQLGFSHFGAGVWFTQLGLPFWNSLDVILLGLCLLGLIRVPAAIIAGFAAFFALKLFFYLVYPSYYRHEALFIVFIICMYWMAANGAGSIWGGRSRWIRRIELAGIYLFILVLALQSIRLIKPLQHQIAGIPYSRSADLALMLEKRGLSRAIVMADPDTMLEPLAYYSSNPLWFLRQQQFGRVVRLSKTHRPIVTPDDMLADADRLRRQTGRTVVILDHHGFQSDRTEHYEPMFAAETITDHESVQRFRLATRLIARLRPSGTDEDYDVYVYPRQDVAQGLPDGPR